MASKRSRHIKRQPVCCCCFSLLSVSSWCCLFIIFHIYFLLDSGNFPSKRIEKKNEREIKNRTHRHESKRTHHKMCILFCRLLHSFTLRSSSSSSPLFVFYNRRFSAPFVFFSVFIIYLLFCNYSQRKHNKKQQQSDLSVFS